MLFLLRLLFFQARSVLALLLFMRLLRLFSLLFFSRPPPEDMAADFLSTY